jgi:hypothetical protein
MTEQKPVLEMNDREWADHLDHVNRQSFAAAVVAREDAETKAYLARHFPAEGTDTPDDKTDERTEQEKQLAAAVAAEAEAFLSRQ